MRGWLAAGLFMVSGACTEAAPPSSGTEDETPSRRTHDEADPKAASADDDHARSRPAKFPAPGTDTPSYLVEVYNFAGAACEFTLWSGEGYPPGSVPVVRLEPDHRRLTMFAGESMVVREVGGDAFGVSAGDPDKDGSAIVIGEGCHEISMADAGFTDAQLAAMRPHTLEACCTACDGPCSGCTIPDDDSQCTPAQVVNARCTLWRDVMDCRSVAELHARGPSLHPPR